MPQDEIPPTAAFGWSGDLNVLDVKCMLSLDRYRKINVNALSPLEVYPDGPTMAPENNLNFLVQCARRMFSLNLVDRDTAHIYLRMESGRLAWVDAAAVIAAARDPDTRAAISAFAPEALRGAVPRPPHPPLYLEPDRFHTLGRWGTKRPKALRSSEIERCGSGS